MYNSCYWHFSYGIELAHGQNIYNSKCGKQSTSTVLTYGRLEIQYTNERVI